MTLRTSSNVFKCLYMLLLLIVVTFVGFYAVSSGAMDAVSPRSSEQFTSLLTRLTDIADANSVVRLEAVRKQLAELERRQSDDEQRDDLSVALGLKKKVRVLIWVCTMPKSLQNKAKYVRDTWAKRSDKTLFFSSETNTTFPTIGLDTPEGRNHLIAKTMQAFRYIYKHHFNDYDWFMKADDDTYVVVENLRYFLSSKNTSKPVYYGHWFRHNNALKGGFHGGGAGYVLSKEALRRLATRGSDPKLCRQDGETEDVDMARCFLKLGVAKASATDRRNRTRFHSFQPEVHLTGGAPHWYPYWDEHHGKTGPDTLSPYPITFHYVAGRRMAAIDYLLYGARRYGVRLADIEVNKESDD